MSNAVLAPQYDERTATGIGEIRVIAGGLVADRKLPRHARAERANIASAAVQEKSFSSLLRNVGGIGYGLSVKERNHAIVAGFFFVLATLAAMAI